MNDQKIKRLWGSLGSAGITSPLTAIEQLTYLIFLKRLEVLDDKRKEDGKDSIYAASIGTTISNGEQCRWSQIKVHRTPARHLRDVVFPWLRQINTIWANVNDSGKTEPIMADAQFLLDLSKDGALQNIMIAIDDLFGDAVDWQSADFLGDVYEHILHELKSSGKNGQFRTPRHIARFMVNLLEPNLNETVIDPACGTSGFLTHTINYLKSKTREKQIVKWDGTPLTYSENSLVKSPNFSDNVFTGFDIDRTMVRIGWMNLMLHGIESPDIQQMDALSTSFEYDTQYDIVLANPPFKGSVDKTTLHPRFDGKPTKSELLFMWMIIDLLKIGGRAAVIVPEGLLFSSSKGFVKLRSELVIHHKIHAVISLPAGAFEPYTGVKTSILVFEKCAPNNQSEQKPKTDSIWFYDMESDGYTLNKKRDELPNEPNDLWDALKKYTVRNEDGFDTYHQPEVKVARYRLVDDDLINSFSHLLSLRNQKVDIQQLFPDLPSSNPVELNAFIEKKYVSYLTAYFVKMMPNLLLLSPKKIKKEIRLIKKIVGEQGIELGDLANRSLSHCLQLVETNLLDMVSAGQVVENDVIEQPVLFGDDWYKQVACDFSKLDGEDSHVQTGEWNITEVDSVKCWRVPVRKWIEKPNWMDESTGNTGSHHDGVVLSQYVVSMTDDHNLVVDDDLLDFECIEANQFNLTAKRYKPFDQNKMAQNYRPPEDMIRELIETEDKIIGGLKNLLVMLEDS